MKNFDLIIAGAGASGLMAARCAGRRGLKTLLLEQGERPGRKILISGGGRCNVTNKHVGPENYLGGNSKFCLSALKRFTPEMMLAMLREAGIALEEREHGQMFCRNSAGEVLDWLLAECESAGCELVCAAAAETPEVTPQGGFILRVPGQAFYARALIIATGGPSFPQCGASSTGMSWAKALGHSVIPPSPALVPLAMPENWVLRGLEGVSAVVEASLVPEENGKGKRGEKITSFTLPLLFTHTGASGPAILQISSYWSKGRALRLNFLPGRNLAELLSEAAGEKGKGAGLTRNFLSRLLPERLALALLPPELAGRKLAELSRRDMTVLAEAVQGHTVIPSGNEGMRKAEASRGGVKVDEVSSSTLESRLVKNLHFCGEVLDVCGQLGGYNLHWAWASGFATGNAAL